MALKQITEAEFDAALNSGTLFMVEFGAPWCAPCKTLEPVLEKLAGEVTAPIFKVDIDDEDNLCKRFGIKAAPVVLVFKDGKQIASMVGLTTKERLMNMLGMGNPR